MKEIKLTKGLYAIVDDNDYAELNKHKWYAMGSKTSRTHYAARGITTNGKLVIKLMHRIIFGIDSKDIKIDHIDHNGLNNKRSNLRQCTHAENTRNRTCIKQRGSTSKYKGVNLFQNKYYRAQITVNRKNITIGYRKNEKAAALLYNAAAIKYFGEFANLNKV